MAFRLFAHVSLWIQPTQLMLFIEFGNSSSPAVSVVITTCHQRLPTSLGDQW